MHGSPPAAITWTPPLSKSQPKIRPENPQKNPFHAKFFFTYINKYQKRPLLNHGEHDGQDCRPCCRRNRAGNRRNHHRLGNERRTTRQHSQHGCELHCRRNGNRASSARLQVILRELTQSQKKIVFKSRPPLDERGR